MELSELIQSHDDLPNICGRPYKIQGNIVTVYKQDKSRKIDVTLMIGDQLSIEGYTVTWNGRDFDYPNMASSYEPTKYFTDLRERCEICNAIFVEHDLKACYDILKAEHDEKEDWT